MKEYWEIRECDLELSDQIIDFMKEQRNRDFWFELLNFYYMRRNLTKISKISDEPIGVYVVCEDGKCEFVVTFKSEVKRPEYKGLLVNKLRINKLRKIKK